jgi:hypothetical protein
LAVQFSPADDSLIAVLVTRNDPVLTTDGTMRKARSILFFDVKKTNWGVPSRSGQRQRYAYIDQPEFRFYIGQGRDEHRWLYADLLYSPDGTELYTLGFDGETRQSTGALIRVDIASMSETRQPIAFDTRYAQYGDLFDRPKYWINDSVTHMDLDPTGRFIVFGRWETATIGVIDLATEKSWTLPVPGFEADDDYLVMNGNAVANVSFNKSEYNRGLLGIHGLDRVGVYELSTDGRSLEMRDLAHVPSGLIYAKDGPGGPKPRGSSHGAIQWTGDGHYLVAAGAAEGPEEIHAWRVSEGSGMMLDHKTYEACSVGYNHIKSIFTLNGLVPTSTPTPTRTGDPTETSTPTTTPRPTYTPSTTATATSFPSPTPVRVFLPLLLREKCLPESQRLDVVLVIDASSSMAEDGGDGSGRSKLQAAIDGGTALLDQLRLGQGAGGPDPIGDRAGIVSFNSEATLRQELSQDRIALQTALTSIVPSPDTRLDQGIQAAARELTGPRQRLGAHRVIVALTDGRATGGPQAALESADVAKALDITIFTVGLGANLDRDALIRMASRPELCQLLPSAGELVAVFQKIGRDLPCPPWTLWGGR